MDHPCNLSQLNPGQHAVVRQILTTGVMRRRFLDLGIIEDTKITCLGKSPMGDPAAYLIRGAVIAIRAKDSCQILVQIPAADSGTANAHGICQMDALHLSVSSPEEFNI